MTHRVFVYGTLKKGFHNSYLLQDSEFFGGAVTVREPPYSKLNEHGELDWQMAPLPAFDNDEQDGCTNPEGHSWVHSGTGHPSRL